MKNKVIFFYLILLIIITVLIVACTNPVQSNGNNEITYTAKDPGYDPADPNNNLYMVTFTYKDGSGTVKYISEYLFDQTGNLYRINYKNISGQLLAYDNYSFANPDNYTIRKYNNDKLFYIEQYSKDVNGNKIRIYTEYNENGKKSYFSKIIKDTHNNYIFDESYYYDNNDEIVMYDKYVTDYIYNSNGDYEKMTEKEYDQSGILIYEETYTYSYIYNDENKKTQFIDEYWGETTNYTFYPNGNLETEISKDNIDDYIIYKLIYSYDTNNNYNERKYYYDYFYDDSYNPLNYIIDDNTFQYNSNNDLLLDKDIEYLYDAKSTLTESDDTLITATFYWWIEYNYLSNRRYSGYTYYNEDGTTIKETCEMTFLFYNKGTINIDNKLLIKLSSSHEDFKKKTFKKHSHRKSIK